MEAIIAVIGVLCSGIALFLCGRLYEKTEYTKHIIDSFNTTRFNDALSPESKRAIEIFTASVLRNK